MSTKNTKKNATAKTSKGLAVVSQNTENFKTATEIAAENCEKFTKEPPRVRYTFKRVSVSHSASGKNVRHFGAACLEINYGEGWVSVADLAANGNTSFLPYARPLSTDNAKIARVKLLEMLGGVVSPEAREAAKAATENNAKREAARKERELAIINNGKTAYTRKASKSAGVRFDRLCEKYA